jgi:hypothetical protein
MARKLSVIRDHLLSYQEQSMIRVQFIEAVKKIVGWGGGANCTEFKYT